jgi:hypothetical protein
MYKKFNVYVKVPKVRNGYGLNRLNSLSRLNHYFQALS